MSLLFVSTSFAEKSKGNGTRGTRIAISPHHLVREYTSPEWALIVNHVLELALRTVSTEMNVSVVGGNEKVQSSPVQLHFATAPSAEVEWSSHCDLRVVHI